MKIDIHTGKIDQDNIYSLASVSLDWIPDNKIGNFKVNILGYGIGIALYL